MDEELLGQIVCFTFLAIFLLVGAIFGYYRKYRYMRALRKAYKNRRLDDISDPNVQKRLIAFYILILVSALAIVVISTMVYIGWIPNYYFILCIPILSIGWVMSMIYGKEVKKRIG